MSRIATLAVLLAATVNVPAVRPQAVPPALGPRLATPWPQATTSLDVPPQWGELENGWQVLTMTTLTGAFGTLFYAAILKGFLNDTTGSLVPWALGGAVLGAGGGLLFCALDECEWSSPWRSRVILLPDRRRSRIAVRFTLR